MSELERINTILKEYGLNAKKSFGQNFLINEGIIKRIVDKMQVDQFKTVIEIGPGLASLTLPISKKANKIIAVDADRDMIMVLNDIFKEASNVTIIQSDFLKFDPDLYSSMDERLIIGNLPYNITSELIEYMLKKGFKRAGFMVQKEVADKLTYVPNKKDNTALGAFIKMTGDLNLVTDVDSSCFNPAPKVQSAFLMIDQKNKVDYSIYSILKALFKESNKIIVNSLKPYKIYDKAILKIKEEKEALLSYRARQLTSDELYSLSLFIKENM